MTVGGLILAVLAVAGLAFREYLRELDRIGRRWEAAREREFRRRWRRDRGA